MDIYDMECSKPSRTQPRSIASPLALPFSNGRAEHAALRDAVSTYSRCLTFSIRMNEIKVRGGKNTMGEKGSFRIFLAHFFFFFWKYLASLYDERKDIMNLQR